MLLLATNMADARHRYRLCTSYVNILKPNCNISNLNRVHRYLIRKYKIALYEVLEIGRKSELLARFFTMFQGDRNKIEGAIKNGQSRETVNNELTRTQDKDKHNKNTTRYMLDTTIRKQRQIT
jgi:hypothetical protein